MKVKFLAAATGATMIGGSKEFGEYLISLRDARKQTDPTFSMRDVEIAAHYEHAKEKHPVFADILTHKTHTAARYYKITRDEAHAKGDCSPFEILLAEYAEVLEAIDARDKAQAVYECYDCIAVLLRLIDMIEETAEKDGWQEEGR